MNVLKRLDKHFGTPQRFESLLSWGGVVVVAVCMLALVLVSGCAFSWGEPAEWLGQQTLRDGVMCWPNLELIP